MELLGFFYEIRRSGGQEGCLCLPLWYCLWRIRWPGRCWVLPNIKKGMVTGHALKRKMIPLTFCDMNAILCSAWCRLTVPACVTSQVTSNASYLLKEVILTKIKKYKFGFHLRASSRKISLVFNPPPPRAKVSPPVSPQNQWVMLISNYIHNRPC